MPNFDTGKLKLFLLERLKPGELQRTLLMAAIIGVAGALATIGFRLAITGLEQLFLGRSDSLVQAAIGLPWWQRLLYPALGGICAGLLLQTLSDRLTNNKNSDYMEAITLGDGSLNTRQSLIRAGSSALSVASGSSIGREGSMVQLAALMGSLIGRWRCTSKPKLRLLVACGAAAGITAAYNAPLAGALFVAEIVLRSVAIDSLGPLLVASVMANLTVHQFFGFGPAYHMPVF
ncbi:MAG TPA: chloride channel protein, partial [Rhodocyclaceae bacterium]|nr:chloride channel protein [Rhodocyclaceae bacterium]